MKYDIGILTGQDDLTLSEGMDIVFTVTSRGLKHAHRMLSLTAEHGDSPKEINDSNARISGRYCPGRDGMLLRDRIRVDVAVMKPRRSARSGEYWVSRKGHDAWAVPPDVRLAPSLLQRVTPGPNTEVNARIHGGYHGGPLG